MITSRTNVTESLREARNRVDAALKHVHDWPNLESLDVNLPTKGQLILMLGSHRKKVPEHTC